jgi:hypothetical protein
MRIHRGWAPFRLGEMKAADFLGMPFRAIASLGTARWQELIGPDTLLRRKSAQFIERSDRRPRAEHSGADLLRAWALAS